MIIIGGLGSIFGCFAGAAFIVLLPVVLKNVMVDAMGVADELSPLISSSSSWAG